MKLDIVKLAREAGAIEPYPVTNIQLQRFVNLIIEECAKVCDAAGERFDKGEG